MAEVVIEEDSLTDDDEPNEPVKDYQYTINSRLGRIERGGLKTKT